MIITKTHSYNNHQIAVALHEADSKKIVIFCHGFRGSSTGPARFFVRAARQLETAIISSVRFDQYGSGNSEGEFEESRFDDWIATTVAIAREYMSQGYAVALFGQSMGASTVINAAMQLPELRGFVAWVPDATIRPPQTDGEFMEEGGQRVSWDFWRQAHAAQTATTLSQVTCPGLIVQCTDDEYVDDDNRQAISKAALPHHRVATYEDYSHSSWSYQQASSIIDDSVHFLADILN
ncbi:MAG: alpha/beta fold hydrolase [Candidatus Saccharimonas sp.]|nr:alpha/beta fold hydrolase [Candidatus Saccharimonas sp.]